MQHDLKTIARQFQISGEPGTICPVGAGHINDTFSVPLLRDGVTVRYILQRINHDIFRDPSSLMDNVVRVTEHIRSKVAAKNPDVLSRQLRVIATCDGWGYYQCPNGCYWRMYNQIENTVTYDVLIDSEQGFEGARMFGAFQKMLCDLPGKPLYESIPDFHNTPKRLDAFLKTLADDPCNRAGQVKDDIAFILHHAPLCRVLSDLQNKGLMPVRITHNDTKINNVLFDRATGKGVCVIDLDTVMPGLVLYDIGDMVRTAACPAAEDERDLSKVYLDISRFEAIARGFAAETSDFFTQSEKKYLDFAGILITFEQMIRFLADHLAGDVYYKICRPGQNADRARTQKKLVQSMLEQQEQMKEIADAAWRGVSQRPAADAPGGTCSCRRQEQVYRQS